MLNKDRFTNGRDMVAAFEADPCMHQTWALAYWLFCEFHEDRLAYLRELDRGHGISTCALAKEIKRLERLAEKGGAK